MRIRIEMTFGRLTTKWRLFCGDLLASNGIRKNCQIIRVGAKLHNFVINSDNLNFISVDDNDCETLQVEALPKVTFANNGYYPIFNEYNNDVHDDDVEDRRNTIVDGVKEYELSRPDYNLQRNS